MIQRAFEVQPINDIPSLEDQAYMSIREAIITGRIKPGTQLRQINLANDLGVSQRTVREALARLTAEGLVSKEAYKGYKSLAPDLNTQTELYEMRAALEGIAMEHAAQNITPGDLQRMRELLPNTGAGDDPASASQVREANREFHWIAIRASSLPQVIRVLSQVWDLILTYYNLNQFSTGRRIEGGHEDMLAHEQLIKALEERNGAKAREINTTHLLKTLKSLKDHLKEELPG